MPEVRPQQHPQKRAILNNLAVMRTRLLEIEDLAGVLPEQRAIRDLATIQKRLLMYLAEILRDD